MKMCVVAVISVLVGLATGWHLGCRYYDKHYTNLAIQKMVENMESSDAVMASMNAHAIGLIDSGHDQTAVQILSFPVADYYFIYASSRFTNEERLKLRALIDGLASSNQVVAAEIAKEMSNKPAIGQTEK
jgi:hypothetical protein